MQSGPFQNHRQRSPWQLSTQYRKRVDFKKSFVIPINRMKMGWLVIVVVKPNHDSKESGHFRHLP